MAKKNRKKNLEALENEKKKIITTIADSDLDYKSYMEELNKIEKINQVELGEKKPKMDPQTKAAIIKGIMILGVLLYESRNVIQNKLSFNLANKN